MKLQNKILLVLLPGIGVLYAGSQLLQQRQAAALTRRLAAANLEQEEAVQWRWFENLQHAFEISLVGAMSAGEMDRFRELLDSQKDVSGVRELSLHNMDGVVAFSSDPQRLKATLPADLQTQLLNDTTMIRRRTADAFEIYKPLPVSASCIDCHADFQGRRVAGVLTYRFSTASMDEAARQWNGFVADFGSSMKTSTAVTASVIGAALALLLVVGLRRMLVAPLDGISRSLDAGATEVEAAAATVATASQNDAAGAGEQASSLEETASSLEQVSAMTQKNAAAVASAKQLASEACQAAEAGAAAMEKMAAMMKEIETSNAQVCGVLKTIDAIALQTNILALNAAVEAARAGASGEGFGVVAEEVRNLARRSAEAARSTAEQLDATLKKIHAGGELSGEVIEHFDRIVRKTREESDIVGQIAGACTEQGAGIVQMSASIRQIDSVTQANAASFEESAASAEEMSAQARTLRDTVRALVELVHGRGAELASRRNEPGRGARVQSLVKDKPHAPVFLSTGAPTRTPHPRMQRRDLAGAPQSSPPI